MPQDTLITRFALRDDFSEPFQGFKANLQSGFGTLKSLAIGAAGIGAGLAAGFAAFGVSAVRAASDMEALKSGLTNVAGSAEEADRQFARLKELAKLPGLDLEPLVRGSIALQATGMSAAMAEATMREFGNALAVAGRGAEDLADTIYGIQQLQSSPTVLAEDLNIIAERVPQVRRLLQQLYGTSRSEEIAKLGITGAQVNADLTRELEKGARFAGGAANAFVNLAAAWKQFQVALATPLLPMVTRGIETVSTALTSLESSGTLNRIGEGFAKAFDVNIGVSGVLDTLSWVVAALEEVPKVIEDLRSKFARNFNDMRLVMIKFVSVLVGFATSAAIVQGILLIVEAYKTLRTVIASAAAAQAALTSMTVIGTAAVLGGLAMGAATLAFLNNAIPAMAEQGQDGPGRLGDIQRRQREIRKMFDEDLMGGPTSGNGAGTAPANASQSEVRIVPSPQDLAQTGYLRDIRDNTRDQLQLDRRILGGGTFGAKALAPVEVGRALGASSSRSRHVNDLVKVLENWAASMAEEMTGMVRQARSGRVHGLGV